MKALFLILIYSFSAIASDDNQTNMNKICGIENISLENIFNASAGSRIVETMSDLRSEGFETKVCNYKAGVALVATNQFNEKYVLIFNN